MKDIDTIRVFSDFGEFGVQWTWNRIGPEGEIKEFPVNVTWSDRESAVRNVTNTQPLPYDLVIEEPQ